MANAVRSKALKDRDQLDLVIKRVRRAEGQISGVIRMLEEGRSCEEIVHQMSAVTKAMNTAAVTLIASSLEECLRDPKRNNSQTIERLQKLFLSLA